MNETLDSTEVNNRKSKLTLLAIVGVALLPLTAAYFAYFTGIGVPEGQVNNGQLLSRALSLEALVPDDVWSRLTDEKKWRLLLPIGASCDEPCETALYTTRQVHVRLGEKASRVERLALNVGSTQGAAYLDSLAESHPLLKRVDIPHATWLAWREQLPEIPDLNSQAYYFLVDQQGFAMMMYQDQHGNELLKDLKRALKFSIDYQ